MTFKNSFRLLFFIFSGIMVFTCQKEELKLTNLVQEENEQLDLPGMTRLGKKLQNPYSVNNMKKALFNINEDSKDSISLEINPTHLYLKYKPKNDNELWLISQDSALTFFDYPLDYEIAFHGDFYHDPELPIYRPTYQYVSLPIEKTPSTRVEYEILEELFIPDEDWDNSSGSKISRIPKQIIDDLVREALLITGNLEPEKAINSLTAKDSWRPAGRVRVFDHVTSSFVGVSGVKVEATRWFTTHRGFTNSSGYFSCDGTFKRDANYRIKWDRYEYSIRSGTYGQAELNGPKINGNWNVDLGSATSTVVDDPQQYYALIHQGAHDYYYGNRFGLTAPPRNSFLKRQLKIAARPESGKSSYFKARQIWFGNDISIQAWNNASDRIYGTIVHELAHAAHRQFDAITYNNLIWDAYTGPCTSISGCENLGPTANNARRLLESWSVAVEIMFTTNRYRSRFGRAGYNYEDTNFQNRTVSTHNHYTAAGWDMMDMLNQRELFGDAFPIDRVSGYTIVQLEQALKGAKSWRQWRDKIRNNYSNPTENFLDELFSNWTD